MENFKDLRGDALVAAVDKERQLIKHWIGNPHEKNPAKRGLVDVLEERFNRGESLTPQELQQYEQGKLISAAFQKKYGHVFFRDFQYINKMRGIFDSWEKTPPPKEVLNSVIRICSKMLGKEFFLGHGEGMHSVIDRKLKSFEESARKGILASREVSSNHLGDKLHKLFNSLGLDPRENLLVKGLKHPYVMKLTEPLWDVFVNINYFLDRTLRLGPYTKLRQLFNIIDTWINPFNARHKMIANLAEADPKLNDVTRTMVNTARDLNKEFNNLMSNNEINVISAFMEFNNKTRFSLGNASADSITGARKAYNYYMRQAYQKQGSKDDLTPFFADHERCNARETLFSFKGVLTRGANTYFSHSFYNQLSWYSFDNLNKDMAMVTAAFKGVEDHIKHYLDMQAYQNSQNSFFGGVIAFYSKAQNYNAAVMPQLVNPSGFYGRLPLEDLHDKMRDRYNLDSSHVMMDNLARDVLRLSENIGAPEYHNFTAKHMNNQLSNWLDKFYNSVPILPTVIDAFLGLLKGVPLIGKNVQTLQEINERKYGTINEYWGANQLMHTLSRLDKYYQLIGDGNADRVKAFSDQALQLGSMCSIALSSLGRQGQFGISPYLRSLLIEHGKIDLKPGVNTWMDVFDSIYSKLRGMREQLRQYEPNMERPAVTPGTTIGLFDQRFSPPVGHVRLSPQIPFAEMKNGNLVFKSFEGYIARLDDKIFNETGKLIVKRVPWHNNVSEPVLDYVKFTPKQMEDYYNKYFKDRGIAPTESIPTLHPALQPRDLNFLTVSNIGTASFADHSGDLNYRAFKGYCMMLTVNGKAYSDYREAVAAMKTAQNPKVDIAYDKYQQPIIQYQEYTPADMKKIYEAINWHEMNMLQARAQQGADATYASGSTLQIAYNNISMVRSALKRIEQELGFTSDPEKAKKNNWVVAKPMPDTGIKGTPERIIHTSVIDPMNNSLKTVSRLPAGDVQLLASKPLSAKKIRDYSEMIVQSQVGYDYKKGRYISPTEFVDLVTKTSYANAREEVLAGYMKTSEFAAKAVNEITRLQAEGVSLQDIKQLAEKKVITMPWNMPRTPAMPAAKVKDDRSQFDHEAMQREAEEMLRQHELAYTYQRRAGWHNPISSGLDANGDKLDVITLIRQYEDLVATN
jgi:DNA-binding transcriptional MerR regulator